MALHSAFAYYFCTSLGLLCIAVLSVGLLLFPVAGNGATIFYLQIPQCTQDLTAPPANLTLGSQEGVYQGTTCPLEIFSTGAYVWTTSPAVVSTAYPSGTWEAVLWLNTTGTLTEYNISLGIIDQSGNFTQVASAASPLIDTGVATSYTIQLPANNVTLDVGKSLALSLLNQDNQGNPTDPGFIVLDSASTPSSLQFGGSNVTSTTSQSSLATALQQTISSSASISSAISQSSTATNTQMVTTTTEVATTTTESLQAIVSTPSALIESQQLASSTTQPTSSSGLELVLLVIAIGAGMSVVLGTLVLKVSKKSAKSEIAVYEGGYYCRKHRVPLTLARGGFWCPIEKRYLNS